MELILASAAGIEEKVIPYDVDIATGIENTFEIEIPKADWDGSYTVNKLIYLPGTEFGGIIGGLRSQEDPEAVYVKGMTWRGLLGKKIISPADGEDYYTISGDLNECIAQLLADFYADDLMTAAEDPAGAEVYDFRFQRYTDLLSGMEAMAAAAGHRIKIEFDEASGTVIVSALRIRNYTTVEMSEDTEAKLTAEQISNGVNHLICLGQGELRDRMMLHLYTDAQGTIVNRQQLFGRNEIAEVYDNTGAETLEDLRNGGIERLEEIKNRKIVEAISVTPSEELEIGDIVTAIDYITGIRAQKPIAGKILRITGEIASIEYTLEGEEA